MDDRPPAPYPYRRRLSHQPPSSSSPGSSPSSTLGIGLGLGLCGAWFLVFAGWQSALPLWLIWIFVGAGFCLVLLGLLFIGLSLGDLVSRRRHG